MVPHNLEDTFNLMTLPSSLTSFICHIKESVQHFVVLLLLLSIVPEKQLKIRSPFLH